MIVINGYDVQRFCKYSVEYNAVIDSGLSFTTVDGKRHECVLGYKYKISMSAEMIDTDTASAILTAISADTFSITFASAAGATVTRSFTCANKPFDLTNRISDTVKFWQVNLVFEEV